MPLSPGDFGLSPVKTLARVGDPTPARDHSVFWAEWFRRVGADRPHLRPRAPGADPSDPTATHEFTSLDGIVIGARLTLPDGPARAGLVSVHGHEVSDSLEHESGRLSPLVDRGVAVLCVRLRGYPGSRRGVGDLPGAGGGTGWFCGGLDAPGDTPQAAMEWVVPRAVGDLANACRALRNALYGRSESLRIDVEPSHSARTPRVRAPAPADRPPVFLHGDSLGGGLAVIVAAQLVGRLRHEPMIDRLAVSLPSLGDWPWRLARPACGVGRGAKDLMDRLPHRAEAIAQRLRLLDALVHASRVRRPALVKLAARDAVVPAPSSAGVFNALGSDPGEKWRFVVPVGHEEAGLANARRHALFERCMHDFLDPARSPDDAMVAWEPILTDGDLAPGGALAAPAPGREAPSTLFTGQPLPRERDAAIIGAYERAGRTLDALPYTPEFEALVRDAGPAGGTPREVFHRLHTLRKAGRLPRLGRAAERAPTIEPAQETLLSTLVIGAAGSMGARDRLPYTPEFDALAERFNRETGLRLSHHDLWRLVAKLAK